MKKALSLVLSLIMLLSVVAGMNISAFADIKINTVTLTLEQPPYAGTKVEFISENANPNLGYTVNKEIKKSGNCPNKKQAVGNANRLLILFSCSRVVNRNFS